MHACVTCEFKITNKITFAQKLYQVHIEKKNCDAYWHERFKICNILHCKKIKKNITDPCKSIGCMAQYAPTRTTTTIYWKPYPASW